MLSYSAIAAHGGWPSLPKDAKLAPGVSAPEVALLRRRLTVTGDLDAAHQTGETYDAAVMAAVKRFQARHGLSETGSVGPLTLAALNVPVETRLRQLAGSRERITGTSFIFGQRYVVVNIPAATVEAIADGKVQRRHIAVVGKAERPSPTLTTAIRAVNLNPTWTVPLSIVKKDIVPKMRKDPSYLARMHMRLLDAGGNEISPSAVDWHSERTPPVTIRQDAGSWNSLGAVRIDMPNPHSVYLHDTSQKNLFNSDVRFHSSGCARVENPRDLAAWLLEDNDGWGRREIDAAIATGERRDIRLARSVPVAWIYLTGWSTHDGTVHFRPDIYGHDEAPVKPFMVSQPRPIITAAQSSGFVLQSGESRPARIEQVSWLDSQ
jgi:murein L,D-transpeptidase YcbB/YkuD